MKPLLGLLLLALDSSGLRKSAPRPPLPSPDGQTVTVTDCSGKSFELPLSGTDEAVRNAIVSSSLALTDTAGLISEILRMTNAKVEQLHNSLARESPSILSSLGLADLNCVKPLAVNTDTISNLTDSPPVPVFGNGYMDDQPLILLSSDEKKEGSSRSQRRFQGPTRRHNKKMVKMFHSDQVDLNVGKILPGKEDSLDLFQGDMIYKKFSTKSDEPSSSSSPTVRWAPWKSWTDAQVNWYVDPASPVDECAVASFRTAASMVEKYTCLRFNEGVAPSLGVSSIKLTSSKNACWAYVGMSPDSQLNLGGPGCQVPGVALHEIGHAIGLIHQQSRTNRDSFVTVDWNNIDSGAVNNFQIIVSGSSYDTVVKNIPYDYSSVMHYAPCEFSTTRFDDPCGRTLDPADESAAPNMGQREYLSQSDIKTINQMYGCTATCGDGIQNQEEEGIDCGGPCRKICSDPSSDGIVVLPEQCLHQTASTMQLIIILGSACVAAILIIGLFIYIYQQWRRARKDAARKALLEKSKMTPAQLKAALRKRALNAGVIIRPSAPPATSQS